MDTPVTERTAPTDPAPTATDPATPTDPAPPIADRATWPTLESPEALTALIGEPSQLVKDKVRPALVPEDVDWLAATPFCVLSTSDADGNLDASPKGDPAGELVHVIDPQTIALAERPGNQRADGYRNILQNPHVGLLCMIPGRGDTLRINGRATLVTDAPFFDDMQVKSKRPLLAVVIDIDEVFHHCSKAFLRSQLWKPETWAPEAHVPRRAVLANRLDKPDQSVEELDEYCGKSYEEKLY
ncbi:pyridoxamine 5'-phosphate oxidase family protein [Brevibacterium litoralis]|uniref:pyridoxamine 5'-phosphate oxidase family protein n=1 Tax=Brevibacterium litoralis TaxID=3138935 RepID=UPI0032ECFFA1